MFWQWLWRLPFALSLKVLCMLLAPVVALFITSRERTDRVKQLDNKQHTLMRDYLVKPLYYFQTHDNAVDEWWYGAYNRESVLAYFRDATQAKYDSSCFFRYACRVMWLWRNSGYGFLYNWFGRPLDEVVSIEEIGNKTSGYWSRMITRKTSFQLKKRIPTPWFWYLEINIGWRTHDGFDRAMYADRPIGTGR